MYFEFHIFVGHMATTHNNPSAQNPSKMNVVLLALAFGIIWLGIWHLAFGIGNWHLAFGIGIGSWRQH